LGYHLIGVDLLRQHPLVGVGPDNYQEHYLDYKYRAMPGRRLEARAMHNMYLSVAVETGLLGFVCFAGILLVALRGLARARARAPDPESRWMAEAVQFAFAVFLVACVFGAAETSKYLWILSGLAMAVAQLALPPVEPGPGRNLEAPGSASLQPTV
jgi:O-antigen ligase